MSPLKILIMALIFVLGLLMYLGQGAGISSTSQDSSELLDSNRVQPFRDISIKELVEIEVLSPKANEKVKKTDEGFRLSSGDAAKKEVLSSLLEAISQLSLSSSVAPLSEKSPAADFGLEIPPLKINILHSSSSQTLEFGSEHPLTKRRYFTYNDTKQVYSIDSFHYSAVLKALDELPDTSILSFSPYKVEVVMVELANGSKYRFLRHDFQKPELGNWMIASDATKGGELEFAGESSFVVRKLEGLASLSGELIESQGAGISLIELSFSLADENNRGQRSVKAAVYRDNRPRSFILHNLTENKAYRVVGGHYKDFLQGPFAFKNRAPFLDNSDEIETLSDGIWNSDAIEITEERRRVLSDLRVLSYDSRVSEGYFPKGSDSMAFLVDGVNTRIVLGEPLANISIGGEDKSTEVPRHLKIEQEGKYPYQAVIGAEEVKSLKNLLSIE